MAPERHLVRTQHSFAVEDLDDYALLEMRVTMTLRLCEELGLNENETTVGQLCDATLDQFDREQTEDPIRYERMPPIGARGVRAPDFRRQNQEPKVLTRGEAERLRRTPQTNGVGVGLNGRGR